MAGLDDEVRNGSMTCNSMCRDARGDFPLIYYGLLSVYLNSYNRRML